MKKNKFYIGIDVSKPYFDASLMVVADHIKQSTITERFDNTGNGIKEFNKWLKANKVSFSSDTIIVIENTGIYHRLIWSFCSNNELPLYIGNGAHIKWSFGIARGKNDKIDSIRLCKFAFTHADELKATAALDPELLQLKDLHTARTKLLRQKNALQQTMKELKQTNTSSAQKEMEKDLKPAIDGLSQSIKRVEKSIDVIIKSNASIKRTYNLLLTVPGIGHITAICLICCTGNFAQKVTGKQLGCYAGVVPFENSSGISIKGKQRVHKMSNRELNSLLHMGATSAINNYPEFRTYFDRKVKEGKHGYAVINAIKNKILLRAVSVVNRQQPYVENYSKAA